MNKKIIKRFNKFQKKIKKLHNKIYYFSNKFDEFQNFDDLRLYLSTEKLFLNNIDKKKYSYNRYDLIVTYMGIKGFFEDKVEAQNIYKKIYDYEHLKIKIANFSENNFITVDKNDQVIQDIFSLAMHLYKKSKKVFVRYDFQSKENKIFNIQWLNYNFSKEEEKFIQQEYAYIRSNFYPFTNVIIWAPGINFFSSIKAMLLKHCSIIATKEIKFESKKELNLFLSMVYNNGNPIEKRVKLKYDRIKNEELKIIVLWLETNLTKMERNKNHSNLYFYDLAILKKKIRNIISLKVKNYVFDCIIHISLNKKEIEELNQILKKL